MHVSGAEVQYSFKESHNGLANDGLKATFDKIAIFKALPTDIRSSYVNETWSALTPSRTIKG